MRNYIWLQSVVLLQKDDSEVHNLVSCIVQFVYHRPFHEDLNLDTKWGFATEKRFIAVSQSDKSVRSFRIYHVNFVSIKIEKENGAL